MRSLKKVKNKVYNRNMPQNNKKRLNRKTSYQLVSICIIVVAIAILSTVGKRVIDVFKLQQQAKLVEEELTSLQDENAALVSTKAKLEDDNYVATYARGEYMFSKGDEKVFYLPSNSNKEASQEWSFFHFV